MELTVAAPVEQRERAALVVTPHPLTLHDQRIYSPQAAALEPDETLAAFLARHGVQPGQQWIVTIGGVLVHEMHWGRVRPKHGHLIECRRVPERSVLRLAAIVALTYVTGGLNVWLQAGARIVGMMVIDKLLGPKPVSAREQTTSPTYSLQAGGQNQARLWQPIGLVLGEPWMVPDLGNQPYTYFANGEQYLWQVFNCGINCADFQSIQIGQTDLSSYQGVTVLRNGMASGNTFFPAFTSVDTVAGGLLTSSGGYVERTGSAGAVRLAVDLVANLYAIARHDGSIYAWPLNIGIEYREIGSATWLPFVGGSATVTLRNASQKPLRVTYELTVPEGQYVVRLIKLDADQPESGDQYLNNAIEWSALKSYQIDTGNYDGQARIAVNIQASGQLNGTLDSLNGIGRASPMPCWNGSAWVTATDRASGLCNPGAILLLLARGIYNTAGRRIAGLGFSDDRIDVEGIKAFMVHCAAKGYHFDLYLQDTTSIGDLMDAVAVAGMGQIDWPDGKLGVAFYAADDPMTGVINMASIKARSFSVEYQTLPTADELELQYMDRDRENAWTSIRATVPGVASVRSTARTQMVGVTGEAHAAALLRFLMGQNIYARKTVTCEMDLEYMTYRRGQVVALSHDMTQWGYGGRLLACADVAGVVRLTLDDTAPGSIPAGYTGRYIGLRLAGERKMRVFPVKPFAGDGRVIELDAAWPGPDYEGGPAIPMPGSSAGNPARDCLWVYDFKETPGQLLRIFSIEPGADGARLTMVPESDEFWSYVETGAYTPPPNNSLLATAPVITGASVTEELSRQGNTFYTELSCDYDMAGSFKRAELWGSTSGYDRMVKLGESRSQRISWRGGLAETWSLELRAYSDTRAAAPLRLTYAVQGLSMPPPNVDAVTISGNVITWPSVAAVDLAGYVLRFNYGADAWWDYAAPLHSGLITEAPYRLERVPVGECTILVKAVDTTGNESADAAFAVYLFPEAPIANVLLSYDQHPAFAGTVTDGALVAGELEAAALDDFYAPADGPMYLPSDEAMYLPSQYAAMGYEFAVSPTEPGTLRLQTVITGAYRIEYATGGAEPMYTPTGDALYEPLDEPIYGTPSSWQLWPGSLEVDGAIAVSFRITLAAGETQGVISEITAVLDVPDIAENIAAVSIGSGGTRLPIVNSYHGIKTVSVTVHSGGTGTSARIVDKDAALGPLIQVINTSGTAVAGTVDALIQGY